MLWLLATTKACRSRDRKSTRLNSSHLGISYAVFCLKKKKILVLVELRSIGAAREGWGIRDSLAPRLTEINAWDSAAADPSSTALVDAGCEYAKKLR